MGNAFKSKTPVEPLPHKGRPGSSSSESSDGIGEDAVQQEDLRDVEEALLGQFAVEDSEHSEGGYLSPASGRQRNVRSYHDETEMDGRLGSRGSDSSALLRSRGSAYSSGGFDGNSSMSSSFSSRRRRSSVRSELNVMQQQLMKEGDPLKAMIFAKTWNRQDRFAGLTASWMDGGARVDPDAEEEVEAEEEEEEEQPYTEEEWQKWYEEQEERKSDEDSEEYEIRLKELREQREAEASAMNEEAERMKALNEDPTLQGHLLWLTGRPYNAMFTTATRHAYIIERKARERSHKKLLGTAMSRSLQNKHEVGNARQLDILPGAALLDLSRPNYLDRCPRKKPVPDESDIADYDWFRAPTVQLKDQQSIHGVAEPWPMHEKAAFCWRGDFVDEVLKAADPDAAAPTIKLQRAQEAFKKNPTLAFALCRHREVVSLHGHRELWSPVFIQSLEVLRKIWKRDTEDENDVRLSDAALKAKVNGREFPLLSGRQLPLQRRGEVYDDDDEAFGPLHKGDEVEVVMDSEDCEEVNFARTWVAAIAMESCERPINQFRKVSQRVSLRLKASNKKMAAPFGEGLIRRLPRKAKYHVLPNVEKCRKMIGDAPPLPKVPVSLPHRQCYKAGKEAWASTMIPPPFAKARQSRFNFIMNPNSGKVEEEFPFGGLTSDTNLPGRYDAGAGVGLFDGTASMTSLRSSATLQTAGVLAAGLAGASPGPPDADGGRKSVSFDD